MASAPKHPLATLRALTFDIDWAPDWSIAQCIEICRQYGVPATLFVTHDSPFIRSLRNDASFELGIHPNFHMHSSHGSDTRSVLDYCLTLVPNAPAMRTHGLYQSSALWHTVADCYPSIEADVSLFLPFHPCLQPTDLYMGKACRRITRIPYFWEDDIAAQWPRWSWSSAELPATGLQVFNFHPIHVGLNMADIGQYTTLKTSARGVPLWDLPKEKCDPYRTGGYGTETFLRDLLGSLPTESFRTVSEITAWYRERNP